jgi:mersacidin/lichenicidin family type 2 lantibiotic
MKTKNVIRAWKDVGYRQHLSEADRAKLPAHPAGMIELTDADLGVVSGGCANTVGCNTQRGQCQTEKYTLRCCPI